MRSVWKMFQSRLGFKETKEDRGGKSLLNASSVENVLGEIGRDKKKTQHIDIYQVRIARRFLQHFKTIV